MSGIKHYKDVSYVKGHVRVNLRFAKYGPRFAKAQEWLGQQVLADSKLYMPLKTGSLQQRSYVAEGGRHVVFPGHMRGICIWARSWSTRKPVRRGRARAP